MTLIASRSSRTRLVVGWVGLLVAVLVPFSASLAMIIVNRLYWRCMEGVQVSFAPLLISCGAPNLVELIIGWTGTVVTIGGLFCAAAASIASLIMIRKRQKSIQRVAPVVHLVVTTMLVLSVVAYFLVVDPIGRAERAGAWTTATSTVALSALVLAILVGAVIRVIRHNVGQSPPSLDDGKLEL